MIASAELYRRTRLAILLGEDAGDPLRIRWQAMVYLRDERGLFLPAKAIRQGFGQAKCVAGLLRRATVASLAIHLGIDGWWQHRHRCGRQQHTNQSERR